MATVVIVVIGVVDDLITVQAPPGQVKEHLSASHWTTQFPKGQIWLHCLTPGEQIIWQFPPVQLWLHSSAFDEQVILHSPPVQLCSHRLESQCNVLHLPPVHDCVQFIMEEEQANLSQPPPVHDCRYAFIIRCCIPAEGRAWLWRAATLETCNVIWYSWITAGLVALRIHQGPSARYQGDY